MPMCCLRPCRVFRLGDTMLVTCWGSTCWGGPDLRGNMMCVNLSHFCFPNSLQHSSKVGWVRDRRVLKECTFRLTPAFKHASSCLICLGARMSCRICSTFGISKMRCTHSRVQIRASLCSCLGLLGTEDVPRKLHTHIVLLIPFRYPSMLMITVF